MASLPALFIELKADVSSFTSKMGTAQSEVEKLHRNGGSHFDGLATVGKAAFLGLGAAAVAFGTSAVKVGIDQEEANARLTTALRNTGSAMTALSEPVEAAESRMRRLGFTNGDTTDSLTTLTNATHNPTKALGDLGLAADIARARHIDLSTATDILAKVETGHVALLGRLGINTKDATGATISQTEAIKRLSDMYGGQADAYSKTFAGRMATLKSEVENVQEQVGMFLIPKIEALVHVGAGAIEWAEKNKTAAEALAVVIGGPLVVAMAAYALKQAEAILAPTARFFMSVASEAKATAAALAEAGVGMDAVLGPIGLVIAATTAVTYALNQEAEAHHRVMQAQGSAYATAYLNSISDASNRTELLKNKITELTVKGYADQKTATGENYIALQQLAKALSDSKAATEGASEATKQQAEQSGATSTAAKDLGDRLGITADMADLLAKKVGVDLSSAAEGADEKIAALNDRLHVASPQALDLRDAMAKLSDRTADAKEKADAFKTSLDLLIGSNISAEKATVNFYGSIDQLGEKIRANKTDFDAHTKAGRDNITMVESSVEAIRNHVEAMKNQGFTADQLQAAFAGDTEALRKQLEQSGLTKAQIDRLIQSYNLVPASLNTVITADTDPAQKAWNDLMAAAQPYLNLLGKLSPTQIKGTAGGITVPHFAAGGSFGPGDMLVGEDGPEFMHIGPDGRGYVRNAGATRAMFPAGRRAGGAGGGTTINYYSITVPVAGNVTTERDLIDAIHGGLLSKQQRQPLGFVS